MPNIGWKPSGLRRRGTNDSNEANPAAESPVFIMVEDASGEWTIEEASENFGSNDGESLNITVQGGTSTSQENWQVRRQHQPRKARTKRLYTTQLPIYNE